MDKDKDDHSYTTKVRTVGCEDKRISLHAWYFHKQGWGFPSKRAYYTRNAAYVICYYLDDEVKKKIGFCECTIYVVLNGTKKKKYAECSLSVYRLFYENFLFFRMAVNL